MSVCSWVDDGGGGETDKRRVHIYTDAAPSNCGPSIIRSAAAAPFGNVTRMNRSYTIINIYIYRVHIIYVCVSTRRQCAYSSSLTRTYVR